MTFASASSPSCVGASSPLTRRWASTTLLIEMGVDLETVRRVLGHRDIATTLRYIGKTPTALRGAADKLGEAMG